MRKIVFLIILLGLIRVFPSQSQDLKEIVLSNQLLVLCEKGESFQLNVNYIPEVEFFPFLNWESTHPDVAYVDQNGMVTPLKPGFSQVIVMTGDDGDELFSDTCDVHVGIDPLGKKLIIQKWNNTLILNNNPATNGGYQFMPDNFQWYVDNRPILDATSQSYSAGQHAFLNPYAKYAVSMFDMTGSPLSTCPVLINPVQVSALSVYPNPVVKGQSLQVELNLPEKIEKEGELQIYTAQGALVDKISFDKQLITMPAPAAPGHYILRMKVSGQSDLEYKIWVK